MHGGTTSPHARRPLGRPAPAEAMPFTQRDTYERKTPRTETDAVRSRPPRRCGGWDRDVAGRCAVSETIVCGIDGKAHSWRAMRLANELSLRTGRRLQVLHITAAAGEPAQRDQGEWLHSAIRGNLGRTDLPVLLETGAPAHELARASRRAVLLVIGTRGHSALRQALRGSVSTAVIRHAACPVIIVPPGLGYGSHRTLDDTTVLCAVRDERDLALAATGACWAQELGLGLALASVLPPPRMPVAPGVAAPPPTWIPSTRERITKANEDLRYLAACVSSVAPTTIRTRVATGPVGPQLRRLAASEGASIIVVGAESRGAIRAAVAGSPGRHLLRHGSHPIMVCPSAEAALGAAERTLSNAALRP